MTVGELMVFLKKAEPDEKVVLWADTEGNVIHDILNVRLAALEYNDNAWMHIVELIPTHGEAIFNGQSEDTA